MVQLIVGEKGKGKTKHLLDKVNNEIKEISGNIVYLDKSTKHMYELNNKVRLIDVSQFLIDNSDEFVGFVKGIISQDHDLQQMYFDSFLKIACLEGQDITPAIEKLKKVSAASGVDFVLSISVSADSMDASLKDDVIVAL
ncbi:MAG: twitching motility protein PilT [Lachnospiraceae bacterium]|nr:twitching motility protein PilT [Lachnospiraceae bacterium]